MTVIGKDPGAYSFESLAQSQIAERVGISQMIRGVSEPYRVYYGDGGEEIDSRFVKGLVNRQVRE
jgi:hypothetical protein